MLEIIATLFGLVQSILILLKKKENWIFYLLNNLTLILFSLQNKLYGDVFENLVYVGCGITGLTIWYSNKVDEKYKHITYCKNRERIYYLILFAAITTICYLWLISTDDALPILDAVTTGLGLTATIMMTFKKVDSWIVWFVDDILMAVVYFMLPDRAIYLCALNIIWIFLAVGTWYTWHKESVSCKQSSIKRVYIAAKFNKGNNFKDDFRSELVDITVYNEESYIKDSNGNIKYNYVGPFYCEQASNGDVTSTACNDIVKCENDAIEKCDEFIVYFDEHCSPGSITEIVLASLLNKKITIFFKETNSKYNIKSENWYPITFAMLKADKVSIKPIKSEKEIIDYVISI